MSSEFIPPSDEIKRLFILATIDEGLSKPPVASDDLLFTEDEMSKMPTTLLKAIRRTNTLLQQTEATKKVAIEMNNELKGIHSLLIRYARKTIKVAEKSEDQNLDSVKPRGFRRKCRISDSMCEFMGLEKGTMSSRVEVNQAINLYVKEQQLVDKENAQKIAPDEKLWALLSESARGNKITYFSIQKYLKHHYV